MNLKVFDDRFMNCFISDNRAISCGNCGHSVVSKQEQVFILHIYADNDG